MSERQGYTYILASQPNGTLYIGVTNDITERIRQHRCGEGSQFVQKYKVFQLVYFEEFGLVEDAIVQEKTLKAWRRVWKMELIEKDNPHWLDLASGW